MNINKKIDVNQYNSEVLASYVLKEILGELYDNRKSVIRNTEAVKEQSDVKKLVRVSAR